MRHQDAANFGRTSEADVAHDVAGAKHFAHGNAVVAVGCQDVEHARWNASPHRQFSRSQRGQRREFGGFDDHWAASRQRGCDFAGDHGQREIPGCDGRAHADGLLQHHQAAVVVKLGQGFAVDPFGFFGKPFHKTGAVGDFAFGFGQRFALFGGEDARQVILVGHQQLEPFAQNGATLFGGFVAPSRPRGIGGVKGSAGIGGGQVGHIGEFLACCGVVHIKTAAAFEPLTVDQRIGFEQAGVVQQRERGSLHVHMGSPNQFTREHTARVLT